jgi:hypothetical protein
MSSPLRRSPGMDSLPPILELPPAILPTAPVQSGQSFSAPITRFTWTCFSCKKIMDVTDDDLCSMSDRVRFCPKCIDQRKDLNRSAPKSLVNRYVSRIIDEEKKKKDLS